MGLVKQAWYFLATFYTYWCFKLRVYQLKSYVYRWIWEREYQDIRISTFESLQKLAKHIKPQWWRADGWRQLWDATSYPGKAELVFRGIVNPPIQGFDCDDYAVFLTAAITESLAQGVLTDLVHRPKILNVMWFESWIPHGHSVCLLVIPPSLESSTVRYSYMDYGIPSHPQNSVQEVVDLIRANYSEHDISPSVWCMTGLDLTPELIEWA